MNDLQPLHDVLNLTYDSYLSGVWLYTALAALGLGVGILTGLFGVGGGFMVTPMLRVLIGIPYEMAIGSSLCFIVGTSTSGLSRHRRLGNIELRTILILASGSMIGAILGDAIQSLLITHVAGGNEDIFTEIMHSLFVVILLVTAWLVWRSPERAEGHRTPLQRLRLGPNITLHGAGLEDVSLAGMVGVGLGVGILTGLMGVGGGVLIMPLLILVVGLETHKAVGTSLGVVLLAAVVSTIVKGWDGEVSLAVAGCLLATSALGVQIGAWMCDTLHANKIRKYFALIVLLAAIVVSADLIRVLRRSH